MNLYGELEHLCYVLESELSTVNDKLESSGGKLSGDDLTYIDKITHAIKSIKTTMAMLDSDYGDSGNYGTGNYGRSYRSTYGAMGRNARRDSMGRYSRDDAHAEIVNQLRSVMGMAQDEKTKHEIQRLVTKMESE